MSIEVKDLLTNCLCVDASKRFTAKQFLEHDWVTKHLEMPTQSLQSMHAIPIKEGMAATRSLANFSLSGGVAQALAKGAPSESDNDVV